MIVSDMGTALGRVRLWEQPKPRGDRPLVLAITGAFSPLDYLWPLDDAHADYVFAQLPGFFSPPLLETSIAAFAQALDEALRRLYGERPFTALGVSTGALVAMSMPRAERIVAVEPFFHTAPLWAFHEFLDRQSMSAETAAWVAAIFGDRDYNSILRDLARPCRVVVGDVPLEPRRPVRGLPSLTSAADRAMLRTHPMVSLSEVAGGHDLPLSCIRDALSAERERA